MTRFRKILEPFHIGKVETRNRIIQTAAGTSFWSPGDRRVTEKALAYYEAVARGGAGLIMMESPITEAPFDEPGDIRMRLDDDCYVEQVAELVRVIHKHGCPTFMQFYHRGPWIQPYAPSRPRYAASAVPPVVSEFDLPNIGAPRELSVSEIGDLIEPLCRLCCSGKESRIRRCRAECRGRSSFFQLSFPFYQQKDGRVRFPNHRRPKPFPSRHGQSNQGCL